jgi:ABC-type nitrate/sulfonate/bicarbonate transport system permease component
MRTKSKSLILISLLSILCFLVLWEGLVYLFQIEKWVLPGPTLIIKELLLSFPSIQGDLLHTGWIAMAGLFIGLVIGVGSASVLHLVPLSRKIFYPYIVFSQNIPIIALAPLLIIWFGFGTESKLIVVSLVCFFPIAVATLDGFSQADETLSTYLKMEGASRWDVFRHLECPSALPSFFSGLKLSATYSVMGAVIAEWLGSEKGLGVMMTLASHSFRTDRVFVAIFLIILLSTALFVLISVIERRMVFWQHEKRAER